MSHDGHTISIGPEAGGSALESAIVLAEHGQGLIPPNERLDLGGRTYIEHFRRVADRVEGNWTKAVAWLHDTVEDTPVTIDDVHRLCGPVIGDAVHLMTHDPKSDTYQTYVDRIWANRRTSAGDLAYRVKIADLNDNLDVRRSTSTSQSLRKKHQPALDRLLHGRWLTEPLP